VSLRYGPDGGFDAASSASNSCCVNLGLGAGTGAPRPPPPPPPLEADSKPVFDRLGVGEAPFGP
jgi:hypothetical protein